MYIARKDELGLFILFDLGDFWLMQSWLYSKEFKT